MDGTKADAEKAKLEDEDRDDALEDTFPASDPISIGGSTGPGDTKPADTAKKRPD